MKMSSNSLITAAPFLFLFFQEETLGVGAVVSNPTVHQVDLIIQKQLDYVVEHVHDSQVFLSRNPKYFDAHFLPIIHHFLIKKAPFGNLLRPFFFRLEKRVDFVHSHYYSAVLHLLSDPQNESVGVLERLFVRAIQSENRHIRSLVVRAGQGVVLLLSRCVPNR